MTELATSRIALPTGVTLSVQTGGQRDEEAIILLHGFPESHRTWRLVAPALAKHQFVVVPDQRGFGASDKPEGVESYQASRTIADVIALADALGIDRFTLVGHDWGGAIAWGTALKHPDRVRRLVIVNAPHPYIFQRSLVRDAAQRLASQYITAFRSPGMEQAIATMGLGTFFDKSFGAHADVSNIPPEERQIYLDQWGQPGALTAMLSWYRASDFLVPAPAEQADMPAWAAGAFPKLQPPALVLWGMKDKALLPVQLQGLEGLVDDLEIVHIEGAGHFVPWEAPDPVVAGIEGFMARS